MVHLFHYIAEKRQFAHILEVEHVIIKKWNKCETIGDFGETIGDFRLKAIFDHILSQNHKNMSYKH